MTHMTSKRLLLLSTAIAGSFVVATPVRAQDAAASKA